MDILVYSKDTERQPLITAGDRHGKFMVYKGEVVVKFTRITVDSRQMGGIPCIRSLRIPVTTVVRTIAEGMTELEILGSYPDLEAADIKESLLYAARLLQEGELPLAS